MSSNNENDFVLSVGADISNARKEIAKLKSEYVKKPFVIPIKANIDSNFKKVLDMMRTFGVGGPKFGGPSGINGFIEGLRRSVSGLDAFTRALGRASNSLDRVGRKAVAASNGGRVGLNNGSGGASRLATGLMALPGAAMIGSYATRGFNALRSFGTGSIDLFNTQKRAETQFRQVLKNSGMGYAEFNEIKDYASQIQQRTMFGDEAMIAGAGELATYVKNPAQMKNMMDMLADYAAGMSGGNEVNSQQMVELATSLGKAFDGTFDGLRKKGFDTSRLEELKKIEDNVALAQSGEKLSASKAAEVSESVKAYNTMGGDLEGEKVKALQDALKDWKGLAETFAQTDEGKIAQLKNDFGDIRETLGAQLQPIVATFAVNLHRQLPELQKVFASFVNIWRNFCDYISKNARKIVSVLDAFMSVFSSLSGYLDEIVAISGALIAYGPAMKLLGTSIRVFAASSAEAAVGAAGLGAATRNLGTAWKSMLKGGLFAATLWGLKKIWDFALTAKDAYNASDYSDKAVELENEANELDAKKRDVDDRLKLLKKEREAFNAKYPDGVIIGEFDLDDPLERERRYDYHREGSRSAEIQRLENESTRYRVSIDAARSGAKRWRDKLNAIGTDPMPEVDYKTTQEDIKAAMDAVAKNVKGEVKLVSYNPKITQNNNISTDFDSLGKLIKENLREIAVSRLTFKTSAEAAKAVAL